MKLLVYVVAALAVVKASTEDNLWTSDNPTQLPEAIPDLPAYDDINVNITQKANEENKNFWTSDNPRMLFEAIPGLPKYDVNVNITREGSKNLHRIVNGQNAHPHQFPYMAAIFIYNSFTATFCGGSLISERFVLTAAQCCGGLISYIEVLLGAHYYDKEEPTQQRIRAKSVRVHWAFSNTQLTHDIAVIELEKKAALNDYVGTISLPSHLDILKPIATSMSTFTGWGKIASNGDHSETLKYMNSRIKPALLCTLTTKTHPLLNICTERSDNNDNICFGDFGGPLVVRGKQVGIASYTKDGCQGSFFTSVAAYVQWIGYHTDVKIRLL